MQIKLLLGNNIKELEEIVNKELAELQNITHEIIDVRFTPLANNNFIYYYAEILYK
ncbi:hypothetical protein GI482_09040 [Bacillus sp. N3536]|nr:hypothetical protein GI482_09040 [Bacillus sp. N3536]